MFTNFLFLGLNTGVSKKGNPFNVASIGIPSKTNKGHFDAKTCFLQDDVLVEKVKSLTPLKEYSGNIVFANGTTILVTID